MQSNVEDLTLSQVKAPCASHPCPKCGQQGRVNVERVIAQGVSLTRCHCRTCDFSWESTTPTSAAE